MPEKKLSSGPSRRWEASPAEQAGQVARGAVAELRGDQTTPVVARLAMLGLVARHVERNVDELVQEARRGGVSWQEIADVVGITRQGLQKRYGRYSAAPEVARAYADEAIGSFQMQQRRVASLTSEQGKAKRDQLASLMEHLSPKDRANVMQKLEARRQIVRRLGVAEPGDEFEEALEASAVRLIHPRRRRRTGG